MADDRGHSAGTPPAESEQPQRDPGRHNEPKSCGLPSWPRLLNLALAAEYLGVSGNAVLEYVRDGSLPIIRPHRPNTERSRKQRPINLDSIRRRLFDVRDLDALADRWRREG